MGSPSNKTHSKQLYWTAVHKTKQNKIQENMKFIRNPYTSTMMETHIVHSFIFFPIFIFNFQLFYTQKKYNDKTVTMICHNHTHTITTHSVSLLIFLGKLVLTTTIIKKKKITYQKKRFSERKKWFVFQFYFLSF